MQPEPNENYITVVFSNVKDPAELDTIIADATTYPIIKKKEQNNGIVAYVIQGVLPDVAENMFKTALAEHQMPDVNVVSAVGNVFNV